MAEFLGTMLLQLLAGSTSSPARAAAAYAGLSKHQTGLLPEFKKVACHRWHWCCFRHCSERAWQQICREWQRMEEWPTHAD
jgi:hypothetical protein